MESHFSDQKWIYCAFLKFHCFSVYFNPAEKGITPGDTWHSRRVPGVVSRCGGSRAQSTRRAPGRGSRGSATRDTWRAREHPGEVSRQGYSGTGVLLGGLPDEAYGLGTRGQVAYSEASGGRLTAGILGDRCRVRRLPGQLSLAGLAAHSGASGRVLSVGVLGTRVALAGFRGSVTRGASRRTRVLPGGLRRTLRLLGLALGFGTRGTCRAPKVIPRGVSKSGLRAGLRDTWHDPKGSEGGSGKGFDGALGRASRRLRKGFGTRGVLRRASKGGFGTSRRGSSKRVSERRLRAGCRRGGSSKEGGSERVFEGGFEEGLPRGCFGEVAKGSSGRVLRAGFRKGFPKASAGGRRWSLDLRSTVQI